MHFWLVRNLKCWALIHAHLKYGIQSLNEKYPTKTEISGKIRVQKNHLTFAIDFDNQQCKEFRIDSLSRITLLSIRWRSLLIKKMISTNYIEASLSLAHSWITTTTATNNSIRLLLHLIINFKTHPNRLKWKRSHRDANKRKVIKINIRWNKTNRRV